MLRGPSKGSQRLLDLGGRLERPKAVRCAAHRFLVAPHGEQFHCRAAAIGVPGDDDLGLLVLDLDPAAVAGGSGRDAEVGRLALDVMDRALRVKVVPVGVAVADVPPTLQPSRNIPLVGGIGVGDFPEQDARLVEAEVFAHAARRAALLPDLGAVPQLGMLAGRGRRGTLRIPWRLHGYIRLIIPPGPGRA